MIMKAFTHANAMSYSLENVRNLFSGFVNNKGQDQPVHPLSLVSTFIIH